MTIRNHYSQRSTFLVAVLGSVLMGPVYHTYGWTHSTLGEWLQKKSPWVIGTPLELPGNDVEILDQEHLDKLMFYFDRIYLNYLAHDARKIFRDWAEGILIRHGGILGSRALDAVKEKIEELMDP